MINTEDIDWMPHDACPEGTCTCTCGAVFLSHAKWTLDGIMPRKPCPGCKRTDGVIRVQSPPEYSTIRGRSR